MLFKNIHIGQLIHKRVEEADVPLERLTKFLQCSDGEIEKMYASNSLDTEILLRWSKLLQYDFFRIYSQHLVLYSPPSSLEQYQKLKQPKTQLPEFRKNIYTVEMIDFIINLIKTNEKTKKQIMEEYRIPKTTLYKWLKKY